LPTCGRHRCNARLLDSVPDEPWSYLDRHGFTTGECACTRSAVTEPRGRKRPERSHRS
jgi:hypothetical protein